MFLGVCLAGVLCSGSAAPAQSAVGGAAGSSALAALRDSPNLGVQDHAGLFHLDALVKARVAIQDFRRDYHRDLFIETFDRVPAADQKHVSALRLKAREHYFADWATNRARTIGLDGVYVLLCKEPRYVYVLVYPNTAEQAFGTDDAQSLRRLLERELPQTPDAALLDTVAFVRNTVSDNLIARERASQSIRFETVAAIIGAVVVFWLLLSLVRAVLKRTEANHDAAQAGLTASFLGALFGTTASLWICDRLLRAHPPAAPQPESDLLYQPPPLVKTENEEAGEPAA